ncbi:hypothetical protein [Staphylospora marina]|uniref:lysine 5,6-aminomutase reactivase subunit KamB n=1 Tax=Staphylospora marina TaxID=2490858 RepID=UPI0013DDCDE3|nr:hypothetical protein [Staphylospora marina]
MKELALRIREAGIRSLAVTGLSKNAGKTTVLNALVRDLRLRFRIGLLSIGVDGEERDAWSGREKPAIPVFPGMLVATAAPEIDERPGDWELLGFTGIRSLPGEVVIARAVRPTRVKLVGLTSRSTVQAAVDALERAGAELVLIDGAYDRKAAAGPDVAGGVVLTVGAALGRTPEAVRNKAEEWHHHLTRPEAEDHGPRRVGLEAETLRKVVAWEGEHSVVLPVSSLVEWKARKKEWAGRKFAALGVPGALTDRMLRTLLDERDVSVLVVPDATRIMASLDTLSSWYRAGGDVRVLRSVRLLAVAVNPVSPDGYALDPGWLRQEMSRLFSPVPVVDVVRDPAGETGGNEDVDG